MADKVSGAGPEAATGVVDDEDAAEGSAAELLRPISSRLILYRFRYVAWYCRRIESVQKEKRLVSRLAPRDRGSGHVGD
jgi:hypothetical protein